MIPLKRLIYKQVKTEFLKNRTLLRVNFGDLNVLQTSDFLNPVKALNEVYFKRSFSKKNEPVDTQDTKPPLIINREMSNDDCFVEPEISEESCSREEVFKDIAQGDPAILKKLKVIEFEYQVLKKEMERVPEHISKEDWLELLKLDSATLRKNYLAYKRLNELMELSAVEKQKYKRLRLSRKYENPHFQYYNLCNNTMFLRIYEKSVDKLLRLRQLSSQLRIVFDCSYENHMSERNLRACAKQIAMCIKDAKYHPCPAMLHFSSFKKDDYFGKIFPKYCPGAYDKSCQNFSESNVTDIYPREKLVYLSPHASKPLLHFNPTDIYVIGAFVDRGGGEKLSSFKAKQSDLRMAQLPLDYFLSWNKGVKSLPLNIVVNILLDMGYYKDWRRALKHIPNRCINDYVLTHKHHQISAAYLQDEGHNDPFLKDY